MINNKSVEEVKTLSALKDFDIKVKSVSREIDTPSVNSDVENALFGETLPARTFVSRALFSYDVPEVTNLKASFVYNYLHVMKELEAYYRLKNK